MRPPTDRVEGDLAVTDALVVPAAELRWRFSRSSGPGGQGVNTTDSRAELSWDPTEAASLTELDDTLRHRLLARLTPRLVSGSVVVSASEHRAQLRNREAARLRLAQILREALAPPSRRRRPTRRTRGSVERRLHAKQSRARTKRDRRRPDAE